MAHALRSSDLVIALNSLLTRSISGAPYSRRQARCFDEWW